MITKEKFDETGAKEIFLFDGTNLKELLYFLRIAENYTPHRFHELKNDQFILQMEDITIYPGSVLCYFEEEDEYKFFIPN
jgi:hypothetical protein